MMEAGEMQLLEHDESHQDTQNGAIGGSAGERAAATNHLRWMPPKNRSMSEMSATNGVFLEIANAQVGGGGDSCIHFSAKLTQ